jgi:hypothetical protein
MIITANHHDEFAGKQSLVRPICCGARNERRAARRLQNRLTNLTHGCCDFVRFAKLVPHCPCAGTLVSARAGRELRLAFRSVCLDLEDGPGFCSVVNAVAHMMLVPQGEVAPLTRRQLSAHPPQYGTAISSHRDCDLGGDQRSRPDRLRSSFWAMPPPLISTSVSLARRRSRASRAIGSTL